MHDEFSHGADAFRYMAVSAGEMTNESSNWDQPLNVNTKYIV